MNDLLVTVVDGNTAGRSLAVNADGSINTVASGSPSGNQAVIGPTAAGSPASTAPVLVAGAVGGSAVGLVEPLNVSSDGRLFVASASAGSFLTTTLQNQQQWAPGTSNNGLIATALTLMTTELNSLVTSGGVISTGVVVSSVGGASGVFTNANTGQVVNSPLILTVGAIGSAASAGGNVAVWFLPTVDGTNYELTTSVPARSPDAVFAFQARTYAGGEVIFCQGRTAAIPTLKFKVLVQNNTGQSLASSGNTIVLGPTTTIQ